MSLLYILSILIRLLTLLWVLGEWRRRLRDWRLGFLAAALGAVVVFQIIRPVRTQEELALLESNSTDLAWFGESMLTGLAVVFVLRIVSDHRRMSRKLAEQEQKYKSLFEHNQDAVYTLDLMGNFLSSNPACYRVVGYEARELTSQSISALILPEHYAKMLHHFQCAAQGEPQEYELTLINKQRRHIHLNVKMLPMTVDHEIVGVYGIAKDITENKLAEQRIRQMAFYDVLTGLPNRVLFEERLQQELVKAREEGTMIGVMFFDLDRFKLINDTFGHSMGDLLLQGVAERLLPGLPHGACLARISGDEFMLVLPNLQRVEDAAEIAQGILHALERPFVLDCTELFISTSIGIALYPADGLDHETLVKNADTAMYRAKEQGRNNYQLFSTEMNQQMIHRVRLENDLRKALERSEFILYYQPQVNVTTGDVVGLEALVRWQHPTLGMISPAEFIPLAEDTGLIVPLGEWVLRTACHAIKSLHGKGYGHLRAAVNLSARQFQREDLVQTVANVLRETGLEPQYLDLEITESVTMQNVDRAIVTLTQLKELGIHISLDDFGTGYSSLSYLKHFPIHVLKIDRSFVRDITTDPDDAAIASSIIAMAHSLKIGVIAEGVETEEHRTYLMKQGCEEMQGFYFAPPLPLDKVEAALVELKGA